MHCLLVPNLSFFRSYPTSADGALMASHSATTLLVRFCHRFGVRGQAVYALQQTYLDFFTTGLLRVIAAIVGSHELW